MQDEICYILKGYPRTSETFIINEIYLLETLGLNLRIFSIKRPPGQKRHAVVDRIQAPVTWLPEADDLGGGNFLAWAWRNVPQFFRSHVTVARRRPKAWLRAFGEMVAMSFRYRESAVWRPRTVFFKEFLQAGYIAHELLDLPQVRHLHAHFCHGATTVTMFVSTMTGLPFSFTAHAKDIYLKELNPGDLLPRKMRRAKFIATCTGANKQHLDGVCDDGAEVHQVYHGLDTSVFAPAPAPAADSRPLILSVGRLVEKKGFDYLVRACRLLKDRGMAFRCQIVGGHDKFADRIEELIQELELKDVVELKNAVTQDELKGIYQKAAIFALPCQIVDNGDRDGIPNVLAEAMAMELPVVSTRVSGIPEIVTHGTNGLLVPEKNAEALADAMQMILWNPDYGRKLGAAARQTICRVFDSKQNTVALLRLFEQCLGRKEAECEQAATR